MNYWAGISVYFYLKRTNGFAAVSEKAPGRRKVFRQPGVETVVLAGCYGCKHGVLTSLDKEQETPAFFGLFNDFHEVIHIFDRFPVD